MIFEADVRLEAVTELKAWYDTDLGQQMLAQERRMIERALLSVQGERLIQVTLDGRSWFCESAKTHHSVLVAPKIELGMEPRTLIATPEELPVQTAVMDVMVLHHVHEFSSDPHQVLREAARVLRPGGHMILLGFNPWSLFGVHSQCLRSRSAPWNGQFLSPHRLGDWFKLLQLSSLNVSASDYQYPLENTQWRRRLKGLSGLGKLLPFKSGNLFLMMARKDVAGMTPLQPQWNRRLIRKLQVIESKATRTGAGRNQS